MSGGCVKPYDDALRLETFGRATRSWRRLTSGLKSLEGSPRCGSEGRSVLCMIAAGNISSSLRSDYEEEIGLFR